MSDAPPGATGPGLAPVASIDVARPATGSGEAVRTARPDGSRTAADASGGASAGGRAGAASAGDPQGTGPADDVPGDALTDAQLEALLFVAERPLTRRELATITGASAETVDARLGDLEVALALRGLRVVVDGERVALATAPETGRLVGRYVGREPTRLSQATLETLAIVAYRQPATKSAIERIRGVDADYAIRSLVHRRLVVELGRSEAPGRPILYGTSVEFLERFGLTSLDDLPILDAAVAGRLAIPEEGAADASERDPVMGADVSPGAH